MDPTQDPFADPAQNTPNPAAPSVMAEWGQALNDPGVRAMLLQTGLSLMTPPSWGQSAAGHVASAIGSGGEAVTRRDKMAEEERLTDIKASEADSKATAREANAATRESLANTAAARAETAAERTRRTSEQADTKATQGRLSTMIKVQRQYQDYVKATQALNQKRTSDILSPQPALPLDDYQTWLARNPHLQASVDLVGGMPTTKDGVIPTTPDVQTAPPAAQRVPNTTYDTPRGPMKWTGTGWVAP